MPVRNIRFTLRYDGTDFHGWQRQPGVRTVQGELERALQHILRTPVLTEGASRTDAGVHALGQVANFATENGLELKRLVAAVNSKLPEDIAIVEGSEVDSEFSSRFRAKGKIYHYLVVNYGRLNPLLRNRVLFEPRKLDTEAMSAAAEHIRGEREYAAFGAELSEETNSTCRIDRVSVNAAACDFAELLTDKIIRMEVCGSRFLYKMVRTIAGTLLEVGKGRLSPDEIPAIIDSRDRASAGPTLKPHGLYLVKVLY